MNPKPMARAHVLRQQCPNPHCTFGVVVSLDGECFCGTKMILVPVFEELDRYASGEYDDAQIDLECAFINAAMGVRR